jgi:hypothetical protein
MEVQEQQRNHSFGLLMDLFILYELLLLFKWFERVRPHSHVARLNLFLLEAYYDYKNQLFYQILCDYLLTFSVFLLHFLIFVWIHHRVNYDGITSDSYKANYASNKCCIFPAYEET